MPTPLRPLAPLDRRIVGALQIDGRASWRTIAQVLGEPERTVTRRGGALLESGAVVVAGIAAQRSAMVVRASCGTGAATLAGRSLANRSDTTFAYLLTGSVDCVAEVLCASSDIGRLALEELPGIPGFVSCSSLPVLQYYCTVHDWQPNLLTEDEAREIAERRGPLRPVEPGNIQPLEPEDRTILRALSESGRLTCEELARVAGVSEPTARRRLKALRDQGRTFIRAVVDPALIGLPVEALLWVKTAPRDVDATGRALAASPWVRYCCALMGEYQLLVDVTVPDLPSLHAFTTSEEWTAAAEAMESSLVVGSLKRSGVSS